MTALLSRVAPFLSKLIPTSLAVKGISKIDPRLANFLTNAVSVGYTTDSAIDYLRDRMSPAGQINEEQKLMNNPNPRPDQVISQNKLGEQKQFGNVLGALTGLGAGIGSLQSDDSPNVDINQKETKSLRSPPQIPQRPVDNLIQQIAPQVHSFMLQSINEGRPVDQSAAIARTQYNKEISNLEKKLKKDWSVIANEGYGNVTQQSPINNQTNSNVSKLMELLKQYNSSKRQ